MRELFISERRYISNILLKCAGIHLQTSGPVVREYYTPPRTASRVRFNNDYVMELVSEDRLKTVKTKAYGALILPNSLGVHVFLTMDERTSQPLMTELLGGEAFSMKYFKEHIEKVEDRLANLSPPINLRRTSYCRIFVIENDICFLAFLNDDTPVLRGERELLCSNAESSIACSMEGAELVYVDGWIRTYVAESERKLEAVWRRKG
jgi:hypothetical protein